MRISTVFRSFNQISICTLLSVFAILGGLNSLAPTVSALPSTNAKFAPCAVKGKSQPKNTYKTETIAFKTVTSSDPSLTKGQIATDALGHSGKRLITYTPKYKNGKLVGCKHTGTKVSLSSVNTKKRIGTYVAPVAVATPKPAAVVTPTPIPVRTPQPVVTPDPAPPVCTNGTYINSAGNTICSPEQVAPSSGVPAGATARCVDGSYSFSQSHSGTCSHHGGVSSWL